jgi:hypothetical protein
MTPSNDSKHRKRIRRLFSPLARTFGSLFGTTSKRTDTGAGEKIITPDEYLEMMPVNTAKDGTFQRMRLPKGEYKVCIESKLGASCIDGGSPEHRHRPPPPPDYELTYVSPSIRVQRLEPYESPEMSLEEATRSGQFTLIGNDCQDHVQIRCEPDEIWRLHATTTLNILSCQDDIEEGRRLYSKPSIVRELQRLDELEAFIQEKLPRRSLLRAIFACFRREIVWALPNVSDHAACTQLYLQRFCDTLFNEASIGHRVLEYYAMLTAVPEEKAFLNILVARVSLLPVRPDVKLLYALGRTIAEGGDVDFLYELCIRAIMRQTDKAPYEDLVHFANEFGLVLWRSSHQYYNKATDEVRLEIMNNFIGCLDEPVDYAPHFPDILTQPITLDQQTIRVDKIARYMWLFVTAAIRGRDLRGFEEDCRSGTEYIEKHAPRKPGPMRPKT